MSVKALSDFTFYSRYSRYLREEKRRETWGEAVKRMFDAHRIKYEEEIKKNPKLQEEIDFAEKQVTRKRVLGSQRALQYGGAPTLKRNERIYNCSGLHINKPKAFQDVAWVLLAGCGAGFSIQKQHVAKLPFIHKPKQKAKEYVIPDSCEGWADAVGILMSSYFEGGGTFPEYNGFIPIFDYSQIRPKGALIAGQFKAPGPDPLEDGIEKIRTLIDNRLSEGENKLKPIDCYDILMHIANFVVSAGLRRAATICLFSKNDQEMIQSKTGNWFQENPQRGRSNNSVVIKRDEITKKEFDAIFLNIKEFGEPGWLFVDDYQQLTNPCCEIQWNIEENDSDECTVGFCNLSEINGKFCDTEEKFLQACRAAAIIGTLQAGYTDFPYLGKNTEEFVKKEALLGVSITGWMDNPDVLFDPKILEKGAAETKKKNEEIAAMLNINCAARICTAKPSGHTSCILGTASGIHPHHARRYIRRVQSNKQENAIKIFKETNPLAVEESVWSTGKTDEIASFLCEVPQGSIVKNQLSAIDLLEKVKLAQKHWVKAGINDHLNFTKGLSHSVSNTITVRDGEWEEVRDYIFKNRKYFTGISLLSASGDLDYQQAPFSTVLTPNELVKEYGDASVFASGLIVDSLTAFDDNLWVACDCVLKDGEQLEEAMIVPTQPIKNGYTHKQYAEKLQQYLVELEIYNTWFAKKDIIRRINQFADRYFNSDVRQATYCLKHVSLWKTWCDLKREYKDLDWATVRENEQEYKEMNEQAAVACSGNSCEIAI